VFVSREKTALVRKDFLDCVIELRNRSKGVVQDATISAKNPKKDLTFRKLIITTGIRDLKEQANKLNENKKLYLEHV
jgi:hypothetical protein